MPDMLYSEYCANVYGETYAAEKERLTARAIRYARGHVVSEQKAADIEKAAQKEAIKQATILSIRNYTDVEAASIWAAVCQTHMYRKSGIDDLEVIGKVVSADQSWKKSSGHAFEEMIKMLAEDAFEGTNIEILLQRDLSKLIKADRIKNEPRDISWLKEQIKGNVFDLYDIFNDGEEKYCFGCIQSKTSIRDRVGRDREPSMQAMQSFFWSVAVVLDGDFLRMPKFIHMVNGGNVEYPSNGWHGMYVFSDQYTQGRIYPIGLDLAMFKEHAIKAANYWKTQRQWFNSEWNAEN